MFSIKTYSPRSKQFKPIESLTNVERTASTQVKPVENRAKRDDHTATLARSQQAHQSHHFSSANRMQSVEKSPITLAGVRIRSMPR